MSELPAISVIVVTRDRFMTIRQVVRHLRSQTIRDQIELVIVAPPGCVMDPDALIGFANVIILRQPVTSRDWAAADGVRRATAKVVALIEDHCFPTPDWAAAMVRAHEQPVSGVGSAMYNANPSCGRSWVGLFLDYGPWVAAPIAKEMDDLPGHNSSYKRAALLELGDELGALIEPFGGLHKRLRQSGHRLCVEPAARTFHTNVTAIGPCLLQRFHGGRSRGGLQARQWSPLQRFLRVFTGPFIPFIWMRRLLGHVARAGLRSQLLPGILPAICLSVLVRSIGEVVGYICGPGQSVAVIAEMEFDRGRFLTKRDLLRWDSAGRDFSDGAV